MIVCMIETLSVDLYNDLVMFCKLSAGYELVDWHPLMAVLLGIGQYFCELLTGLLND